MVIKNVNSSA